MRKHYKRNSHSFLFTSCYCVLTYFLQFLPHTFLLPVRTVHIPNPSFILLLRTYLFPSNCYRTPSYFLSEPHTFLILPSSCYCVLTYFLPLVTAHLPHSSFILLLHTYLFPSTRYRTSSSFLSEPHTLLILPSFLFLT